ncbi:MAG: Rrf2 family transcriptional regulator [Planctomycetota bacterium]|nr:MAG: Rrf2 family transcriptional regulator [Planctomycetota bacterium]
MDVLRRNTDYALRAMVNLARHYGRESVSTKQIASQENISYQLACKILQRLHNAKLVESCMGPKGGFRLSREPSKINLLELIRATQGPVQLNRCLLGVSECPRRPKCTVSNRLAELQRHIDGYLGAITLDELSTSRLMKKSKTKYKSRRKNV